MSCLPHQDGSLVAISEVREVDREGSVMVSFGSRSFPLNTPYRL